MITKPKTIKTVALVANSRLDRSGKSILKKVDTFLKKREIKVCYQRHTAVVFKKKSTSTKVIMEKADAVITFGGDGTLIKLARHATYKDIPVFSINLGTVGFLTEIQKTEKVIENLERLMSNKYRLDVRNLLRVTLYRKGKKIETFVALNEAVINQGNFARLIELSAEINQRRMVRFKADGIIVATPTGSTGHSLSAGGPIVHPQLNAFVFTPVCPSALTMRPIIIPNNRQLTLTIETERKFKDNQIALTIDGQIVVPLKYGDKIKIRRSTRHFLLARMTNTRYYRMLRDKLHWGH
jgi:NAD+ kinase